MVFSCNSAQNMKEGEDSSRFIVVETKDAEHGSGVIHLNVTEQKKPPVKVRTGTATKSKCANKPFAPVERLLRGYGVTPVLLASYTGSCYNTAASRLNNPGTLTLNELFTICHRAGIPVDELRSCIRR